MYLLLYLDNNFVKGRISTWFATSFSTAFYSSKNFFLWPKFFNKAKSKSSSNSSFLGKCFTLFVFSINTKSSLFYHQNFSTRTAPAAVENFSIAQSTRGSLFHLTNQCTPSVSNLLQKIYHHTLGVEIDSFLEEWNGIHWKKFRITDTLLELLYDPDSTMQITSDWLVT